MAALWSWWLVAGSVLSHAGAVQLFGNPRVLRPVQTLQLGLLATQLSERELQDMELADWGALSTLGALQGWTAKQVRPGLREGTCPLPATGDGRHVHVQMHVHMPVFGGGDSVCVPAHVHMCVSWGAAGACACE